jgi:hypothetical protein
MRVKAGTESLTANKFSEIRERRNQLVAMYSEDFAKAYGWTLNVLPKKKRNFKGIEDSVDLSRFQPFYAMFAGLPTAARGSNELWNG